MRRCYAWALLHRLLDFSRILTVVTTASQVALTSLLRAQIRGLPELAATVSSE